MSFRLISADGAHTFELRSGLPMTLGRALSCDLPVLDPTISRRHAELTVENGSLRVRDLGSSNGTFVSGQRTDQARLRTGERIVFGRVAFELRETAQLVDDATAEKRLRAARAGTTIIRQVPVPDADQALRAALSADDEKVRSGEQASLSEHHRRDRLKLALLVEMSKALTRTASIDELLERTVAFTFRLLDVDLVAVLLGDDASRLETGIARARDGVSGTVPPEISPALVATVMEQKVAVLSDSQDTLRPTPSSALAGPGSAACTPLVGGNGRVVGVVYVESATPSTRVSDEDLDFLVAFAGIVAVALDNFRFGERVRREALVRENFERFFTPHIADRIASLPQSVVLGGERRVVAVLFADIRGFTPLAATMAPDETAALLNEFFSEMVECVFRHGGTLDKFLGDAVMAQWGAPLSDAGDADRALNSARDMLTAVASLGERRRSQGKAAIEIGIGLNYGEVFAGFTGSERRLEYTVIGDTVNTASRLCAWAEGQEILMSAAMREAVSDGKRIVEREPLMLRGKTEAVRVFRTD
ncbi:MAG: adenylate/guanylate cyclase domain-containing protein [Gemmatimonadota bacterium]